MECSTKNSEVTLCYSPCDNTPSAPTKAVTTGGESIRPCIAMGSMESLKNDERLESSPLIVPKKHSAGS